MLPKAEHLSWEEAAAPTLVGTTAYRMLHGWAGNELRSDDVVLVWGASGGLGTQAIQLVRIGGEIPVAVVSSAERGEACVKLGAAGWINRCDFTHWGIPPRWDTVPTSVFVCEEGGMVVVCAGTSGYSAMVDVRYLWTRQKRFQGSHGTNDEQAVAYNELIRARELDPCLGQVLPFEQLPQVHQDMADGRLPPGNTVVLVGAAKPGLGREG